MVKLLAGEGGGALTQCAAQWLRALDLETRWPEKPRASVGRAQKTGHQYLGPVAHSTPLNVVRSPRVPRPAHGLARPRSSRRPAGAAAAYLRRRATPADAPAAAAPAAATGRPRCAPGPARAPSLPRRPAGA